MNKEDQILELLQKMDRRLENVETDLTEVKADVKHLKDLQGTVKTDIDALNETIDNNHADLKGEITRRFNFLDSKIDEEIKELQRV